MNLFRADLHIHSRHSRATSKAITPRHLAAWARVKGIDVLGTGDFTHPGWFQELEDQFIPVGDGLFRLADERGLSQEVDLLEGADIRGRTLFMLQAEISSIYKRGGQVRKVHNLVFVPSLDAARRLNQRLDQVGNLASDGRPILGLDSHDLLEMVLEVDDLAFLVPAHIWTPWFSVFGSKSGFNAMEECFGDLTKHIFALETGLSSDPEMNWLWSALDRYRLISNSDAHSGANLAREANLFSGEPSYEGIYRGLKGEGLSHKFLGTIEFFPEEGKYHLDGHRKCGVALEPAETMARGGVCPVCGKPLTIGVLNRVLELADRQTPIQPVGRPGFVSLIPLAELLAEILKKGAKTKAVGKEYGRLITRFGSELNILLDRPLEDLAQVSQPLALAVDRMRRGEVIRQPGYDGEYGVIRVFTDKERKELSQGRLVNIPGFDLDPAKLRRDMAAPEPGPEAFAAPAARPDAPKVEFNPAQQRAIDAGPGPALVLAGPGTGKTQTLLGRLEALVQRGHSPRKLLAVTFTRRAAGELRERLLRVFGRDAPLPRADTLHALAFDYWTEALTGPPIVLDEESARRVFAEANPNMERQEARKAFEAAVLARETLTPLPPQMEEAREAQERYSKLKEHWNLTDYSDLLEFWLEKIRHRIYVCPFTHVLVDEIQDLTALQLAVVTELPPPSGEGFFGIGDPRQSIYGFRGARGQVDEALRAVWPDIQSVRLDENYRSAAPILELSAGLFQAPPLTARRELTAEIRLFEAPSAESEASWIGERVRRLLGATSHSLVDAEDEAGDMSPGDIAVLTRLSALTGPILRTLHRLGVPAAAPQAEGFWNEPRVAAILAEAGKLLGIAGDPEEKSIGCPDRILTQGPKAVAAYLQETPPFDRLFWEGSAFRALVRAFDEHGGWRGLLNWVHLQNELELVRARSEKVQVMTLHAAKGLEFRAVFLPALEDGLLPFAGPGFLSGASPAEQDLDEERRLFYVGLTRAKEQLHLSHAAKRNLYGRTLQLPPSRFLKDLPAGLLHRSTLVARRRRKEEQLNLLG